MALVGSRTPQSKFHLYSFTHNQWCHRSHCIGNCLCEIEQGYYCRVVVWRHVEAIQWYQFI
jgi:hypothetical protein